MALPTFSIITPSNSISWLKKAAPSVLGQLDQDWEWVILANGDLFSSSGSEIRWSLGDDQRIRVITASGVSGNVGLLKSRACSMAIGQYVVELDHDDQLSVDCLTELRRAFESHEKPVFVFSDCASVTPEGTPYVYSPNYGWTYRKESFQSADGTAPEYLVPNHPLLLPQNVAKIYHAPNHVRAWRADAYAAVGGHNPALKVCDDLDLMCKLFAFGPFYHIQKNLYTYLVHGENTWLKNQSLIDEQNWAVYDRNIEKMALVHARRAGFEALDLGGGINSPVGWTSVDVHDAMVTADLRKRWPWDDNTVGVIRAYDFVEHIEDQIHVMNEAYRVLTHGGLFLIEVPSTDGRGAFQDPSHVSFWNSNSMWYYTKEATQRYIKHLGVNCKFQAVRVTNYFPSKWHEDHNILYTKAHLAAIKDGPRLHGLIEI